MLDLLSLYKKFNKSMIMKKSQLFKLTILKIWKLADFNNNNKNKVNVISNRNLIKIQTLI
jgi:hypothetical protein